MSVSTIESLAELVVVAVIGLCVGWPKSNGLKSRDEIENAAESVCVCDSGNDTGCACDFDFDFALNGDRLSGESSCATVAVSNEKEKACPSVLASEASLLKDEAAVNDDKSPTPNLKAED